MRQLAFALIIVAFAFPCFAGTKVLDYGFEDWTGNADTTPGYPFSIPYEEYWNAQKSASGVLTSCGGRTAHSGSYFFRYRMDQNADACLGSTPSSENVYIWLAANQQYPIDSGDNTDLATAITTSVMTLRFYFRLTGNWPPTGTDANPMSKFIRTITGSTHYEDDDSSLFIQFHANGDTFGIADPGNVQNYYYSVSDLDDGAWHSISIVYTRLNETNTNPNYNIKFWVDDWGMEGAAVANQNVWLTDGDANYQMVALFVNYGGAANPTNEHAVEYDDFEVWDGLPDAESSPVSQSGVSGSGVSSSGGG